MYSFAFKNDSYIFVFNLKMMLFLIIGENERCQPEGEFFGVIVTSECGEGLYCDQAVRRCVRVGY